MDNRARKIRARSNPSNAGTEHSGPAQSRIAARPDQTLQPTQSAMASSSNFVPHSQPFCAREPPLPCFDPVFDVPSEAWRVTALPETAPYRSSARGDGLRSRKRTRLASEWRDMSFRRPAKAYASWSRPRSPVAGLPPWTWFTPICRTEDQSKTRSIGAENHPVEAGINPLV